jgi:hypothetical protein
MGAKMKFKAAIIILLLVICNSSALAGCCFYFTDCFCCTCEPRDDFGRAYTLARSSQILNPGAEANLEPVEGINGRAAANLMQKYVNSFSKTEAPQPSGGITSVAVSQSPGGYTQ